MKKALISMVILIAFSMLTMSVSAPIPDYYAARFYGYATESCRIYDEYPGEGVWPIALGKGTFRISGLAIVTEDTDYYWAHRTENPNTCIWTHRTSIKVSWNNNEKLTVHMWPSYIAGGMFNDTMNMFMISNLTYFGYHRDASGSLHLIRGNAIVWLGEHGELEPVPMVAIILYRGTEHWLSFLWVGKQVGAPPEYTARQIIRKVTAWPIEWHPKTL